MADSHVEAYLKKLNGDDADITFEPQSNVELYLASMNGMDVELPEEPGSRVEALLADLAESGGGSHTEKWKRPESWPDLDHITLGQDTDYDELYLTYDLSKTENWGWIGLTVTTSGQVDWTLERGHLSGTEFVADETFTVASNSYFRQALDHAKGDIQLWHIRGYQIVGYGFVSNSSNTSQSLMNNVQPCVEVGGRLSHIHTILSSIAANGTSPCLGTAWMERYGVNMDTKAVLRSGSTFWRCYNLQSINVSNWDIRSIKDLHSMFSDCYRLHDIDVSNWDTGSVTSMDSMFAGCRELQNVDVSNWDTGSVTNMSHMFAGCHKLQNVNVSNWDTGAVTSMGYMFYECENLQDIDLSNWDTRSVTRVDYMFADCHELQNVNVSNWDTGSLTNASMMFSTCYNLQNVNAQGVDVSKLSYGIPDVNYADLTTLYPFIIGVNHSYINATRLTRDSVLRIVQSLPVVTDSHTITLGPTNLGKLTEEEIAIATEKGWTVA